MDPGKHRTARGFCVCVFSVVVSLYYQVYHCLFVWITHLLDRTLFILEDDVVAGFLHGGFLTNLCTTQSQLLMTLTKMTFENIVGKGENAGNQHILLFPQCFEPYQ